MRNKRRAGLVVALLVAAATFLAAGSLPEAPVGLDGLTNGSVPQNVMDADSAQFQEQEAPSPNGVGPIYNDVACVNCHQNQAPGGAAQVLEMRAGHNDGSRNDFMEPRNTNRGHGTFVAATAVLSNGDTIPNRSLINQRAICPDAQEHITSVDNIHAMRLSLPLFGDGFVEAVPDAALVALAKQNGGEAIEVPALENNGATEVGRFGWKDQHASLLSFASDAYLNEMGITNPLNPTEATTVCNPSGVSEPNNIDDINTFAEFMRALKAPPRGPINADVRAGQAIFERVGCNHCHVETLETAPVGTAIHGGAYVVPSGIGGLQFHPFGDFLLHDIGTGDGIVQNGPMDTQYKVRTMPLWGLRMRTQMMHDAQTMTYSDAIARHENEAADAARNFRNLTSGQKALLYIFLKSL